MTTEPASKRSAALRPRLRSLVKIQEPRPYFVSFARSMASSKSSKTMMGKTGPKTSTSCAMSMPASTPSSTVGP